MPGTLKFGKRCCIEGRQWPFRIHHHRWQHLEVPERCGRFGPTEAAGFNPGWQSVKRNKRQTQQGTEMFEALKTAISNLVEDGGPGNQLENKDGRLATAALLIHVATVNGEMSATRRETLHAVLKSGFGLDDPATVQLINDASVAEGSAIDLYHFTRQLNDSLDGEGRRRTVKMMWEIVYADGSVNEFEDNIIWRVADLLGVSSRQRVELRQQIATDRAAIPPAGIAEAAQPSRR
jgi:uncharacterized tellurite resistance protein B-like protein